MTKSIRSIFSLLSVSLISIALVNAQLITTSNNICVNLATPVLHIGQDDDDTEGEVSVLQDFLKRKGLLVTNLGGYYGVATTKAVLRYQSQVGIRLTGNAGPLTREAIRKETCDISSNVINIPPTTSTINSSNGVSDEVAGDLIAYGIKNDYNTNEFVNFSVAGYRKDGSVADSSKGLHMQYSIKSDTGNMYYKGTGDLLNIAGNGAFNMTAKTWDFSLNMPSQTDINLYNPYISVVFYCSKEALMQNTSTCRSNQVEKKYYFKLNSGNGGTSSTNTSGSNLTVSISSNQSNDNTVSVISYTVTNTRPTYIVDVAVANNCPNEMGSSYIVDCSGYLFNINGNSGKLYTGVKVDPYVAGGSSFRFNGLGDNLIFVGYSSKPATSGAVYIPKSIDFTVKLIDSGNGNVLQTEKRTVAVNR